MDPNVTLQRLLDAIRDGNAHELRETANDLANWIACDGFLPTLPMRDDRIRIRVESTKRELIEAYLPHNYRIERVEKDHIILVGRDDHGWSAHGYVIPRLASGNIAAKLVQFQGEHR